MLYGAALRQGDLDWLNFVNTTLNVAMFGHENDAYDKAFKDYLRPRSRRRASPASLRSERRQAAAPPVRAAGRPP